MTEGTPEKIFCFEILVPFTNLKENKKEVQKQSNFKNTNKIR